LTYFCDFRDFLRPFGSKRAELERCVTLRCPCPIYQFRGNEIGLGAVVGVLRDIVGEEEKLQNKENDDQLHDDDSPQRASHRHVTEAIVIEIYCPI